MQASGEDEEISGGNVLARYTRRIDDRTDWSSCEIKPRFPIDAFTDDAPVPDRRAVAFPWFRMPEASVGVAFPYFSL